MKCAICKGKTTYDTSYGPDEFIICHKCFCKLRKTEEPITILNELAEIGGKIRKMKEKVSIATDENWEGIF
jgi:hypothetical protein